ncbi:hypothetical protein ACFV6E_26045 [Streptomyces sp. NPDC059785]|uniref:DUF7144 family membrane protein n=1 Tax=unclassified Streptomyces TaxID=2593676 RepID=UPI003652339E
MVTTTPHHRSEATQGVASGLTMFAAVMLFLVGSLAIFRGIMGIAEDEVFVDTRNYVFKFDLTSWGWIHLGFGVVAVIVSLGLFTMATWARVSAMVIAGLVILVNFLSIPYYPAWSITVIAFSGVVIWALCVVHRESIWD